METLFAAPVNRTKLRHNLELDSSTQLTEHFNSAVSQKANNWLASVKVNDTTYR